MKIFWIFILSFLFSCSNHHATKPRVLVSIAPYAYFIEKLAEDQVEITLLAPEGSNPHLFEPTPQQVQQAYQANLWVYLGENFEQKIATTLKQTHSNLLIVNLGETAPSSHAECKCHHHKEAKDLHIWMNPILAKQQAIEIAKGLETAFPHLKDLFNKNLSSFLLELDALNEQILSNLESIHHQAILVSHPAFGHFCNQYHLEQISIEVEGKDPKPRDIEHTLHHAKNHNVRLVLIQEQHNNKGAEAIATHLGITPVQINPYSRDYKNTLLQISEEIAKAYEKTDSR